MRDMLMDSVVKKRGLEINQTCEYVTWSWMETLQLMSRVVGFRNDMKIDAHDLIYNLIKIHHVFTVD